MVNGSDITQVRIAGDLDVVRVPSFKRSLEALVEDGCRSLVLDFSDSTYMDSAGVGLVLSMLRRMRALGGEISLTNVSSEIMYVLTVARVVDYLPVTMAGDSEEFSELDPSVQPMWRSEVHVEATDLAGARDKVREQVARMSFSPDAAFDLVLAVGEAMGNAVDHTSGSSLVELYCYEDRAVVEVSDCGEGFDVSEVPQQVGLKAERGRGIALMRLLSDSVQIGPRPDGKGTLVRIVKLVDE